MIVYLYFKDKKNCEFFFLNVKCFLKNIWGYPYWKPHNFFLLKICPVFSHSEWWHVYPQSLKVGRAIAPSSFTHEVVLVKFELQIHMEHLSSCQSGFLVVCASQSSVFWVFVIFCQPLNIFCTFFIKDVYRK
jgi:hypothetical protein